MNRSILLALGGLAALVALVLTGHLEASAVVTFLMGLGLERPTPTT